MSPASATDGGPRKPQPWTEEAKLRDGGRPIDWTKINMPGRTPKSLQNTWFAIKKMVDEKDKEGMGMDNGGVGGGSPAKVATPRRKLPGKNKVLPFKEEQDDDDDDDIKDPPKKTTPSKRKAGSTAGGQEKKVKSAIKGDPDDGEDEKEDILKSLFEMC
ncbi:hypothetical protein E4U55_008059 [Claviceps digitariae]|nr:hypothetical protein E4U55_008059 [Claviceps digitariae]